MDPYSFYVLLEACPAECTNDDDPYSSSYCIILVIVPITHSSFPTRHGQPRFSFFLLRCGELARTAFSLRPGKKAEAGVWAPGNCPKLLREPNQTRNCCESFI